MKENTMNFDKPQNENYAAVVVSIKAIKKLEGSDNIVGTPLLGFQAIVGKDTKVGDLGIVFPAETQLSEEFTRKNNLFRHTELNDDKNASGYLEDNRRVKAMKFRGNRSDCLFMPLSSLAYTGLNLDDLTEGMSFDKVGKYDICNKYLVKQKAANRIEKNKEVKFKRIDAKFIPEHYDTENYFRNKHVIKQDQQIVVTQKLHGTSIRIGHTIVARKLGLRDKVAQKLGVKVQDHEYDYVFASRKAIKDINNPNQDHYYKTDIWTEEGKKLEGSLPQGVLVYGELVGWTKDGSPIQKDYTYCLAPGTAQLFVYRVATVNPQGMLVDLTWNQVKEFCRDRGLTYVPELWSGLHRNFKVDKYIDKRFFSEGMTQAMPLDPDQKLVDEGVCVRVDGIAPYILKAKSPIFLQHETKMLDEEAVDLEAQASEVEDVLL